MGLNPNATTSGVGGAKASELLEEIAPNLRTIEVEVCLLAFWIAGVRD